MPLPGGVRTQARLSWPLQLAGGEVQDGVVGQAQPCSERSFSLVSVATGPEQNLAPSCQIQQHSLFEACTNSGSPLVLKGPDGCVGAANDCAGSVPRARTRLLRENAVALIRDGAQGRCRP